MQATPKLFPSLAPKSLLALATLAALGLAAVPAAAQTSYTLTDLGTLGGIYSLGYGVNDGGQVVGFSETTGNVSHAFLYSGGSKFDLNSLIAPGTGFTLTRASGISDTGFITGYGTNSAGQQDAFLLTPAAPSAAPVPEGSTTLSLGLMLVLGLGTLALRARRRKAARQVG